MSQIIKGVTAGNLPPSVPTSFITDSGTAIPAANTLNVNGGSTNLNNNNGIEFIANPNGSDNLIGELTNRLQNSITTTNATPTAISTLPLGSTPGVYTFDVNLAAYDLTDVLGTGFSIFASVRTTGTAANLCGTADIIANPENGTIAPAAATIVTSGNNAVIQVTGIAGKTIDWNSVAIYVFVS